VPATNARRRPQVADLAAIERVMLDFDPPSL